MFSPGNVSLNRNAECASDLWGNFQHSHWGFFVLVCLFLKKNLKNPVVKKRKEKEILLHNPYMFMCSFYIRVYSFGMGANTF